MSAHEQFADDLALLALGALQGDERVALEKHLEGCAACRRELEQLRGDTALLALSACWSRASASRSRERLLKAIAKEPRAPRARDRASWSWTLMPWLAAAAFALAAVFFFQQSDRLSQRVAELQEPISPAAGATRTCARSGFNPDLDERNARDPGRGADSAAAAGQSDLCSRPLQPGFPRQQHAGFAAAKGVRTVADSNQRSAHPGRSLQARRPWQRDGH